MTDRVFTADQTNKLTQIINEGMSVMSEIETLTGGLNDTVKAIAEELDIKPNILKKAIKHDGNPFVGWQLGNCEVYTDVNGNVKVRKNEADPSAKVDGIIAMIMALHCHLDNVFVSDSYGLRLF